MERFNLSKISNLIRRVLRPTKVSGERLTLEEQLRQREMPTGEPRPTILDQRLDRAVARLEGTWESPKYQERKLGIYRGFWLNDGPEVAYEFHKRVEKARKEALSQTQPGENQ